MLSSAPRQREVTLGASLGSAASKGAGVSAELCVAVLNACGPIPAFSCSALHPAPAGCPVYSVLCAQWMSLPSLKCWCVARFPSFGLARSEQRRCRAQLCATLQDLLLPALLGSAEVLSPHTEALEASLGWRSTGAAVLKRGWRWIIAGGHEPRFQSGTARIPWGKRSFGNGVPVPACSGQPLDMRMWVLFKGIPWCAWQYRHSCMLRITSKGTQKSWTPCSERSVWTDLSTLPLYLTRGSLKSLKLTSELLIRLVSN